MGWRYRYEVMRRLCVCGGDWFRIVRYPRRLDGLGHGRNLVNRKCDCVLAFRNWSGSRDILVPDGAVLVWDEEELEVITDIRLRCPHCCGTRFRDGSWDDPSGDISVHTTEYRLVQCIVCLYDGDADFLLDRTPIGCISIGAERLL